MISSLILINSKLNSLKNDAFINFQSSKAYFQNMQILLLKEDQNKSYELIDSQNLASTISSKVLRVFFGGAKNSAPVKFTLLYPSLLRLVSSSTILSELF